MNRSLSFGIAALIFAVPAAALDLAPLWDFSQPDVSEARFRGALATATGDDALILQTQIARTYGLRGNFAQARSILEGIEPRVANAGSEVRVRYALEWGRTFASTKHSPESQPAEARELARAAYLQAFALAEAARLDDLAIDALHMLAFVDTAPADQLKWGSEALALALASSQPAARKWEASLRNNVGYALHELGRYGEALAEFQRALVLREAGTDAEATRVAHWMVAWTLRSLNRIDEALALQLRLEQACEAAGAPDEYVFEELEHLYRLKGDASLARYYADKKKALVK